MIHKRTAFAALLVVCVLLGAAAAEGLSYRYAEVATKSGPLNMRESASIKAPLIVTIPKGTILAVTPGDDWCQCVYDGKEGYVQTKFLSFIEPLPFYALSLDSYGPDVLKLNERLKELGYLDAGVTAGDAFGAGTDAGIRRLQRTLGMEETGTATPELQAYLAWGPAGPYTEEPMISGQTPSPAPSGEETRTMTVTITAKCSNYNHVGNNWSKYCTINGKKVSSGDEITITLGASLSVYAKITEKDSKPDVGSAKEDHIVSQADFDDGFSVALKVSVRENAGRYTGNTAAWTVTFAVSP